MAKMEARKAACFVLHQIKLEVLHNKENSPANEQGSFSWMFFEHNYEQAS